MKGRSFLTLLDYTPDEIRKLLDLAAKVKEEKKNGVFPERLKHKNIVLLFEKTSTRTRCAFETAGYDEGARVTFLSNSQMGKKESLEDTAKVLGRFYDGTPLFVLERGEEWTKVRIGHGEGAGVMAGWMRTEDLAFGDDTLHVEREAIRTRSEQVLIRPAEPFIGSRAGRITAAQFDSCLVIGETDQGFVIVYYLPDGDVGRIPATSLENGNG